MIDILRSLEHGEVVGLLSGADELDLGKLAKDVLDEQETYTVLVRSPAEIEAEMAFEKGQACLRRVLGCSEAAQWFKKAAELGHARAGTQYGLLLAGQGRGGVKTDHVAAVSWLKRGAEAGDPDAKAGLSYMYATGNGVGEVDRSVALALAHEAVDGGSALGMTQLGWLHQTDPLPDYASAIVWYHKAAMRGEPLAMANLAVCLSCGFGVLPGVRDFSGAVRYWRQAAALGVPLAMYSLGMLYETGRLGIAQDPHRARHWYVMGARCGDDNARERCRLLRLGVGE